MRYVRRLWIVCLLLLTWSTVRAQEATEPSAEPARIRLAQLALDAPELEIYVDSARYNEGYLTPPGAISGFDPFAPGTYSVAFSPDGKGLAGAIIGPQALTVEAGHVYTAVVTGRFADKDLRLQLIDETAAFPNVKSISSRILVHNLKGAPNIDMIVDGKTIITNLAYGDAATAEQPIGPVDKILFTTTGKPDQVIFQGQIPAFESGATYFLGLTGTYPGELFTDYFPDSAVMYMGDVTTRSGGSIALGSEVNGEVAHAGERVGYALTLKQTTVVDVLLSAATDSALDAYVRVYNADGNLIAENDELKEDDDLTDAGLLGQKLDAGTYTVEAASWGDAFPGSYILQVSPAH